MPASIVAYTVGMYIKAHSHSDPMEEKMCSRLDSGGRSM